MRRVYPSGSNNNDGDDGSGDDADHRHSDDGKDESLDQKQPEEPDSWDQPEPEGTDFSVEHDGDCEAWLDDDDETEVSGSDWVDNSPDVTPQDDWAIESSEGSEWIVDEESALTEDDWGDFEHPRPPLPGGRMLVGLEEHAVFPTLNDVVITVRFDTARNGAVLWAEAIADEPGNFELNGNRIEANATKEGGFAVTLLMRIGGEEHEVRLDVRPGVPSLVLGVEAMAGRFVIDPAAKFLRPRR